MLKKIGGGMGEVYRTAESTGLDRVRKHDAIPAHVEALDPSTDAIRPAQWRGRSKQKARRHRTS